MISLRDRWGLDANPSVNVLRTRIGHIAQARSVDNWFDRFENHRLRGNHPELNLEVIQVAVGAPTVVFMPGTNAYALLYGEFLCALADRGFNVVGFDPRGHGRSQGGRGSYVLAELQDDMDRVVDWAKQRFQGPMALAGSSQGGITAFYTAARRTDLMGVVCHNLADLADRKSDCLTRFPGLGRALRPILPSLARLLPGLPVPMGLYLDLAKEPVRGMGTARDVLLKDPLIPPYVRLKTLASLARGPAPLRVEDIRTPVYILQAGHDTIFPEAYIRDIYDRLTCPHRVLKVLPDSWHYLIADDVPKFIDGVATWLHQRAKA